MTCEVERIVPGDHPALEGHFPGDPIVPGVVILEEVFGAFEDMVGDFELAGFPRVKFLSPLRPGQVFTIAFTRTDPGKVRFTCSGAGARIAQGEMDIRSP